MKALRVIDEAGALDWHDLQRIFRELPTDELQRSWRGLIAATRMERGQPTMAQLLDVLQIMHDRLILDREPAPMPRPKLRARRRPNTRRA